MKRKVVRLGPSTLVLSLPSQWVQQHSIAQGDELEVEESAEGLRIWAGHQRPQKKSVTLSLSNYTKDDVQAVLTHLYRMGTPSIRLEDIPPSLISYISSIVHDLLLGFEITESHDNVCVLDSVSEPSDEKFESLLRRVFLIIKETHTTLQKSCETNTFDKFADIAELRKQHDRFVMFCKRVIVRSGKNQILHWELLTFLMHIEHSYYYLYEYLSEHKLRKNLASLELLSKLADYYDLLYEAYFKKDIKLLNKINSMKKAYHMETLLNGLEKSRSAETVVLSFIRELFRLVQICTSPILAMALLSSEI